MYIVTHDDREKREIKHVYLPLSVYTRYFPGLFLSSGSRIIISGIVHVYTTRTQLDLWIVYMCVCYCAPSNVSPRDTRVMIAIRDQFKSQTCD